MPGFHQPTVKPSGIRRVGSSLVKVSKGTTFSSKWGPVRNPCVSVKRSLFLSANGANARNGRPHRDGAHHSNLTSSR